MVEGEDDRISIQALLSWASPKLKTAIANNRLGIDTLSGGTNLSYKLSQLRLAMCEAYVLLDDDTTGRDAVDKAREQGLVEIAHVTLTTCKGMPSAEIEDWFEPTLYSDFIRAKYGDVLDSPHFVAHRDKWSNRLANAFKKLGKPWNKFIEMEIKHCVADLVAKTPDKALRNNRRTQFDGMVSALEKMLDPKYRVTAL